VTWKMQHLPSASLLQQSLTSNLWPSAVAGRRFDNKQSLKFNDAIRRNTTQHDALYDAALLALSGAFASRDMFTPRQSNALRILLSLSVSARSCCPASNNSWMFILLELQLPSCEFEEDMEKTYSYRNTSH